MPLRGSASSLSLWHSSARDHLPVEASSPSDLDFLWSFGRGTSLLAFHRTTSREQRLLPGPFSPLLHCIAFQRPASDFTHNDIHDIPRTLHATTRHERPSHDSAYHTYVYDYDYNDSRICICITDIKAQANATLKHDY